jgi:hypothetical protein
VPLSPSKSSDGRPKYSIFCVWFRSLKTVNKFDSIPYPVSRNQLSNWQAVNTFNSLIVTLAFAKSKFASIAFTDPGSIVSDYGRGDREIGVRSPAGAKDFSSNLRVQTGPEAHPASCTMGIWGPFPPGQRAAGA